MTTHSLVGRWRVLRQNPLHFNHEVLSKAGGGFRVVNVAEDRLAIRKPAQLLLESQRDYVVAGARAKISHGRG